MSGREASGIQRLVARLFPGRGSARAAPRPPYAAAPYAAAPRAAVERTAIVAKSVAAVPAIAARSVRERDHERLQRRIRRTREAYARLRGAGPAPR
jgi:hypothetical protein